MAILSNVNGKFAVDSTGAIQFSGSAGTSGYILRSNGNAAPTWVDSSTVIGGPYLPLTGGTLSGALAGTSATFSGILTAQSSSSGDYVRLYGSSGTGKWDIYGNGANLRISDNESAGILAVDRGATFGGSVGIGTSSPVSKFEVDGSIKVTGVTSNIGAAAGLSLSYDSGINYINTWASTPLITSTYNYQAFHISGSEKMRIHTDGNVGIGTNSPQERLHVVGLDGSVPLSSYYGSLVVDNNGEAAMSIIGNSYSSIYFGDAATNFAGGVIYEHSSNSMNFRTNGNSEKMRIDSSGKVGIGTTSPFSSAKLDVNGSIYAKATAATVDVVAFNTTSGLTNSDLHLAVTSSGEGQVRMYGNYPLTFYTNNTEKMRIAEAGNVTFNSGVLYTLKISNTNVYNSAINTGIGFNGKYNSGGSLTDMASIRGGKENTTDGDFGGKLTFHTRTNGGVDTERMRITSAGYLNAGAYTSSSGTYHQIATSATNNQTIAVRSYAASPYGLSIEFPSAAPNTTDNWFLACSDSAQSKLIIWSNGDVVNRNNTYGALSDIKLKENIVDATSKLDDLMKVKIRNYNLIGDDKKQIGVVAQELEDIFPNMIDESIDYEYKKIEDKEGNITEENIDLGTTTKSVKYSVFVPMLIKAIQELEARIKELENK